MALTAKVTNGVRAAGNLCWGWVVGGDSPTPPIWGIAVPYLTEILKIEGGDIPTGPAPIWEFCQQGSPKLRYWGHTICR
ncbi:hypothetical protein CRG98_008539 [Punica granatum]|uniref:Uncharacterized protein n=1 Tax=Punica granatum TaxID=22663 RepID=A0A2I0KRF6_PUNGR|nr:hypothetical protein CRG98_008539 [Punica granatum]